MTEDKEFKIWAREKLGLTEWSGVRKWREAWEQWQMVDTNSREMERLREYVKNQ